MAQNVRMSTATSLLALGMLLAATAASLAQSAWEPASGASATLPAPEKAEKVAHATLACAEQEWTLTLGNGEDWRDELRIGEATTPTMTGAAEISIGKSRFAMSATRIGDEITLGIPHAAVETMRIGSRLAIEVTGAAGPASASFVLNGSKRTLDAIWPLCSPRQMDGYDLVAVSENDAVVTEARAALEADIAAFQLATTSEPRVEAASVSLVGGKSLMVTRICGSSWYFGRSGCSVSGFVRTSAVDPWKLAYENEGSTTYLDKRVTSDGWPNIVSVPLKGKPDLAEFRWHGSAYAPDHAVMAQD